MLKDSRCGLHSVPNYHQMRCMCASGQGCFLKIVTPFIWETSSLVIPRYFNFNEKSLYSFLICIHVNLLIFYWFFYSCLQQNVSKGADGNQTGFYFSLNNINEVEGFFCFIYLKQVTSVYFVWTPLLKCYWQNKQGDQIKANKMKKINTEFQDQKRTNRLPMYLMLLAVTCKEVQSHVMLMYTASLLGPKGSQNHFLL